MQILSIVHGQDVRAELFEDVTLAEGHELEEWSIVDEKTPPRPVEEYDAVFIFGGAMNVDEEDKHPWLLDEDEVIRGLVARRTPLLGVCLGGQLLAKAAGAHVGPLPEPEFGFVRTQRADAAAGDPLFGGLPDEFDVWDAHGYAFHVPAGGVELARSSVCSQAFRVGDHAWGSAVPSGSSSGSGRLLAAPRTAHERRCARRRVAGRYDEWAEFGAQLCRAFLAAAQSEATSAASARTDSRTESSSSHAASDAGSSTPSTSRTRNTHGT